MNDITELLADIEKAKIRLMKENIEANAIMFDKRFYYCRELFTQVPHGEIVSPAFVAGLEAHFADELPLKADFIVYHNDNAKPTYSDLLAENKQLREENEKLKKIEEILKEGEQQND